VTSELLDIINAGSLAGELDKSWEEHISARAAHQVGLVNDIQIEHLSQAEYHLIDEIYQEHGQKDQWEIRDWCHQNCAEWTPLDNGREMILLEQVAENVGKSEAEIERICHEARESSFLDSVFIKSKYG